MPYSAKKPTKELTKRIKSKYPKASKKDIRKFIHVFNSAWAAGDDEAKCFSKAWGVLKKKKKKTSSQFLEQLYKLANILDREQLFAEADLIDIFIADLGKSKEKHN